MESDINTPFFSTDDCVNRRLYVEDEYSSEYSSNSLDGSKKRRARLPFHYPDVHKISRVRREPGPDGFATYHRYRYYNKLADPTIDTLAKVECEKSAIRYHRACGVHTEAQETISLAEKKFNVKKEDYEFDAAWQEMLNRETIKLMNAETLKEESEKEHKRTTQTFAAAVEKVKVLEQQLKKDIVKSRSYFEQKKVFLKVLQDLKNRVESLQKAVMDSKASYATCLHNLEMISSEIHERRKMNLPPREPGVGAEWDAKPNPEISIYAPLSVLWECDSQHTDSLSSNTDIDVTSELEHLCQDLSLESSFSLPSVSSIQASPPESLQPFKDEKCIPVSRSDGALASSDLYTTPSLPHYSSGDFPEDSFQDVDLNT